MTTAGSGSSPDDESKAWSSRTIWARVAQERPGGLERRYCLDARMEKGFRVHVPVDFSRTCMEFRYDSIRQ